MQALLCSACGQSHSEFDSRCPACGAALPSPSGAEPFHQDDPFLGRQVSHFRIVRLLGRGGMGVVYQAIDLELERDVALKFLSSPRSGTARDEVRFRREAQATAALDHPNIGTVYEIGEHEDRRFIAMAFYDGEALAARLNGRPGHRLPAGEAVAIAGQLASALAAAHAVGVVHRDLKPDNVMILRDGRVKLLDFGLAKWVESPTVTEKEFAVGTAAYMAPEQFRGESGPAADLWALGAVLYEMLAGQRPFGGERKGMVHAILHEDPAPLREIRPDVPPALERIAVRCLAKEPSGRFGSAVEILSELEAAGLWHAGGSGSAASLEMPIRRPAWRPWAWAAVLSVAAVIVIMAAVLWARRPTPTLYVAVLQPEVTGAVTDEDRLQIQANLQAALLRTLASLDGLAALDSSQVLAVRGTPAAVARALAAGEVVASRAACAGDYCQVDLRRLGGSDGRVLWSDAMRLPSPYPQLFANAVAASLRQGYGDRKLSVPRLELQISEQDYSTYLRLRRHLGDPAALEQVLTSLEGLRQRAPKFVDVYMLEIWVAKRRYLDTGDRSYLSRGLTVAQQALEIAPGDPRLLSTLFSLNLDAGLLDEAESVLERMAEVDPVGSLLSRGQLAERRGRPGEALRLMSEAARLQPSWATLLKVANAEYRLGRLDDARRHLEELLKRSPGNVEGLKALAQIELLSNPDRAVALLRQVAQHDPSPKALTNLGVALLLLRRYGEAERSLRQALTLQPEDPSAALNLADCLLLSGRPEEARRLYEDIAGTAERLNTPGNWQLMAVEAQALAHLGQTTQAVEAIQRALRLTPDNAQLAYEAAVVYALVGDHGSAIFHARRASEGGVDASWFALPFFDPLRGEPGFPQAAPRPQER